MNSDNHRKIVLGAVQMKVGDDISSEQLLQNAVKYVEKAAAGAKIVVFPECFPTYGHFKMGTHMWETAEPWEDGITQQFMSKLASRLGVYIATTLILVKGLDFYNTFLLISPVGEVVARIRKNYTTAFESFYWRLGYDTHIVDTEFGKIGVGICAENSFNILSKELAEQSVCLTLHLHSVPDPTAGGLPRPLAEFFKPTFQNMSSRYASTFGCPAVFINKVGTETSKRRTTKFFGYTRIAEGESGEVVAEIPENGEGVAIAEIELLDSKSGPELGALYDELHGASNYRISPIHSNFPFFAYIFLTIVQAIGHISYACSPTRRRLASRISGTRTPAPPPFTLPAVFLFLTIISCYYFL
ncbi:MAG: carbon-nitrogen hydrolase family protein [Pseudomonadota bacterium]